MALVECRLCFGKGRNAVVGSRTLDQCPGCAGKGHVQAAAPPVDCPACGGSGVVAGSEEEQKAPCRSCGGAGWQLA